MVREIMRDPLFLSIRSETAAKEDIQLAEDLLETLKTHKDECVGMAANMIGVSKRIIAFQDGDRYVTMFNPEIIKSSGAFEAEEGCLSLSGTRKTKRFRSVKLSFQNSCFQTRIKTYTGWTAQIIQHEIDHLNGILI